MEKALIAPSLESGKGDGLVVKVKSFGVEKYVPLLEEYKGKQIVQTGKTISVWDSKAGTLYQVALDDSKSTGKRFIVEENNTIEGAKKYIDWVTKTESTPITEEVFVSDANKELVDKRIEKDRKFVLSHADHKDIKTDDKGVITYYNS